MSKKLLSFLLHELKMIRVRCKNPKCRGAVLEVPIEKVGCFYNSSTCPVCREDLGFGVSEPNWLNMLGKALAGLQVAADRVEVEVMLPEDNLPEAE